MPADLRHQQQSRVRVAELQVEIVRAVGVVLKRDADLTYEEICVALNSVMGRQLMHLMRDQPEVPDAG